VARHVLGSTTDVPALRAQLEALVAAGEHAQVIAILFEILEKVTRDHSDLAARYTSMLRQMYRSKSERISPDQLALFLAQLPANETPTSRRRRPSHRPARSRATQVRHRLDHKSRTSPSGAVASRCRRRCGA
jgi:hypothetical protein